MSGHTPDGGRIISLSQQLEEPSTEQQVQLLHGALRQCLGLIHCVILKEDEEWGEQEGDYETMRKSVRVRLEHLLHTTKDLAEAEETLDVTPDHQCSEVEESFLSTIPSSSLSSSSSCSCKQGFSNFGFHFDMSQDHNSYLFMPQFSQIRPKRVS